MAKSVADFDAVLPALGFALGLRCSQDEISEIVYLSPQPAVPPRSLLAQEALRQLRAYLADAHYQFSLPLAAAGTPFQRRVWQAIAALKAGETISYGELARQVGSSARAVGNACGANPYPLVVPCHRVLAANHGLGGFARQSGGFLLEVKRWLLYHEGIGAGLR